MIDDIKEKLAMAELDDPVALVVMNKGQLHALMGEVSGLTSDPKVATNQIWGIPFEVNDLWAGRQPLLLRASQVEQYRGARRHPDPRFIPALRT